MFDILTTLITKAIGKLLDSSADIVKKEISFRRSLVGVFFDLYDALAHLEEISWEIYEMFLAYAEGRRVVKKIITGKRLTELASAVEKYSKSLRRVQTLYL